MPESASTKSTKAHIAEVQSLLVYFMGELDKRAKEHDLSKLQDPEFPIYEEWTPKLADSDYGSEEYHAMLKEMRPAIEHHYKVNRHHPEHFEYGIEDMNLIDIIEMFCDWKAATMRHSDGDIDKSININEGRFKLSQQLFSIFKNTARDLNW